ncbi:MULTISPECIES: DMT family transporter [unclassified Roseitalea]|uniref:DMT family transporter n=1 Tax=unclassified Roseitalea TaxID=2639107 RepID=UPI00273F0C20|nr:MULTISPECIES: DMT family transporter [unclassified Roseitalea]
MNRPAPGPADYALLGTLSLIWGSAFLLSKIAVADFDPLTLTALRQAIAFGCFVAVAFVIGTRWFRPSMGEHVLIAACALTGTVVPFTAINWGVAVVDSGLAAILMGLMPLVVIVLAHFATPDEKLSGPKVFGVLLGLVGLAILFWPALRDGLGRDVWRQLALLGAATSYGVNALLVKRLVHRPPIAFFVMLTCWSVLFSAVLAFIVEAPFSASPSRDSLAALAALGVMPTAGGAFLMFALIERQGASFFGQINLLVPVAGFIIGVGLAGERPGFGAVLALGCIVAGLVVARIGAGRAGRVPVAPQQ